MTRNHKKPLLYRKANTTAHIVNFHHKDFNDERHTKIREKRLAFDHAREHMNSSNSGIGRDYTPLFKFLLAKVGEPWAAVYAEAVSRLDKPEPVFWMVQLRQRELSSVVRMGENSYYSGLYVDDAGLLQVVDPSASEATQVPSCSCCTHTFNGKPFARAATSSLETKA
ncbi:hypothetical protein FXN63_13005 [Pigmentiphaga aceris]|uniref:Uncharacterized protein n=1 Tax=Pigmentiphaga aceris TaxID=1940612 RepID=A0A5C0AW84_9BURK|nr:hypothetical protein [Pigmentiphaga aceris]QEI06649.1 hypothetical protein FXN63_13005 [Pigmentiphaga aceris]